MNELLWIVGKKTSPDRNEWEFQGIFDDREKAIEACRDDDYFIGPATLNQRIEHEPVKWDGAYYPTLENGPAVEPKGK